MWSGVWGQCQVKYYLLGRTAGADAKGELATGMTRQTLQVLFPWKTAKPISSFAHHLR